MIISVFNRTRGAVTDLRMQKVIRAINVQIERDFEPYWSFGATLRLEGHTVSRKKTNQPYNPLDMRGDGVLYVIDKYDPSLAGEHYKDFRGVPAGVVYLDMSQGLQEDWSVTLSHEALEMIADPQTNLVVQGPHPVDRDRDVFHWFEVCDAVQAQTYEIDGIGVSDFVLPLYFTPNAEPGSRNNFIGGALEKKRMDKLTSFDVAHGGYIGFFDPIKGDNDIHEHAGDQLAKLRRAVKRNLTGRRARRLQQSSFGT